MVLLLSSGERELEVYADASLNENLGIVACAHWIPAFAVGGVEMDRGTYVERYELAAVVQGIESVARIDASERPIHVFSDSEFVVQVLKHIPEFSQLPSRPSFDRVGDLFCPCIYRAPFTCCPVFEVW